MSKTAEISYYVDNKMFRQGIGKAMLEFVESKCGELGIKSLFGIIIDTNEPSIGLMKKCGYTQWAHLPNIAEFAGREVGHVYYGKRVGE